MVYPLSLEEDTYEDSLALLAEMTLPNKLYIASGEDFNADMTWGSPNRLLANTEIIDATTC